MVPPNSRYDREKENEKDDNNQEKSSQLTREDEYYNKLSDKPSNVILLE